MKRIFPLFVILLFNSFLHAQTPDFDQLWEEVKKLEAEGLPKSALKVVGQIQQLSLKNNNNVQFIKTMLFKSKFAMVLEEDAQLKIIQDFKKQIAVRSFPVKHILENLLANLYWQYFNQNRWSFYNRTKTAEKVDKTDFRTWDLKTLFAEVQVHFQNSMQNGLMLQQEKLSDYGVLLQEVKGSKKFRPTLYDFLCHQALDFYKSNETHIVQPAYKFEIDTPDFFSDAKTFSELRIRSKDTVSLQLRALKIYQDLIQFHLKDKTPYALADVNLQRLRFVNQYASFPDKEATFLKALKVERKSLKKHEVSGLYDFEIASVYYRQSQKYRPKENETFRWKAKEALKLCNDVISRYPKSSAAQKCKVLKSQIEYQSLQLTTETFLPVQSPSRLLVRYKNLNGLEFKVLKLSEQEFDQFNKIYRKDEQLNFLQKLDVASSWKSALKNENDYQTHSTEVLMPKLDNGRYVVLAISNDNKDTFGFAHVQITDLALVETETPEYITFQVVDRNNGNPISNAQVKLGFVDNAKTGPQYKNYTTNAQGEIQIKKTKTPYKGVDIIVNHGKETAFFGDYYVSRFYENKEKETEYNAFVFTDRSIYRPGQTVYFKGIGMKTVNGKSQVVPNEQVYVTLYNVNNEEISKLELKTNDFGSVSGEFILPSSGLNGQYYIVLEGEYKGFHTKHYFSVEEYKRPKFQITFLLLTGTYKINDSITVKGSALAYAGSHVTDAKVVYRVHRMVQYPHWYNWSHPWFNSEAQEIVYGETITNARGDFEITFKAIPDASVDANGLPIFNYEVEAQVTDLNGETRSATTVVNVGYHSLVARMEVPGLLDKTKSGQTITIHTENLNGQFEPAQGNIKVYKLNAPSFVLRQRPWAAPDYQQLSKETFKKMFPHEAYTNEHLPENWEKGTLMLTKSFNTHTSNKVELGKIKKWPSGKYLIVLESKDRFGQRVEDQVKTTLFSKDDNTLADKQLFNITTNKETYQVGDNVTITLASAAKNIWVTVLVEKNKKVIQSQIIKLNNNKKSFQVPVNPDDVGGFVVHYSFAAFNSFRSGILPISVPYPETDLKIETLTFRDKLKPGTNETWQFKIRGPEGDRVSAELLASMYDVSLDQFSSHVWSFNPIYRPMYASRRYVQSNKSFGTRNFRVYNDKMSPNYPKQSYDQWNWFGLNFDNTYGIVYSFRGKVSGLQQEKEIQDTKETSFLEVNDSDALNEKVLVGAVPEKKENVGDTTGRDKSTESFDNVLVRKNLQETAFFFPHLKTDKDGNVSFSFDTPETLTQWKLLLLAHTKNLQKAVTQLQTVTQKELMVLPNTPRFLREGDTIEISSKIANLADKPLSGRAKLSLTNAITGEDVTANLLAPLQKNPEVAFTVNKNGNTQVSWRLNIPEYIGAIQYKIVAKAGDFSDGEQGAWPVLSNRMLVTQTLPLWVKSNETRTFTLDKLKHNQSATLKHHKLSLEITSNPAWYAVQALPYLMEYPYECNEPKFLAVIMPMRWLAILPMPIRVSKRCLINGKIQRP